MKYRKKPVIVDAILASEVMDAASSGGFSAKSRTVPEWVVEAFEAGVIGFQSGGGKQCVLIRTLEGEMRAEPGDWIIRGVARELYPCKPGIFAATYEAIDGPMCTCDLGILSRSLIPNGPNPHNRDCPCWPIAEHRRASAPRGHEYPARGEVVPFGPAGTRVVAVVVTSGDYGRQLDPQPAPDRRDRGGCFASCRTRSCFHTKCRELSGLTQHEWSQQNWEWRLQER